MTMHPVRIAIVDVTGFAKECPLANRITSSNRSGNSSHAGIPRRPIDGSGNSSHAGIPRRPIDGSVHAGLGNAVDRLDNPGIALANHIPQHPHRSIHGIHRLLGLGGIGRGGSLIRLGLLKPKHLG